MLTAELQRVWDLTPPEMQYTALANARVLLTELHINANVDDQEYVAASFLYYALLEQVKKEVAGMSIEEIQAAARKIQEKRS